MYADYTFYQMDFYGELVPEDKWAKYATAASDYIDYLTWRKAQAMAEDPAVQKCCCALAEQYMTIDAVKKAVAAKVTTDGIIASESVGSHSRSFRNGAEGEQAVAAATAELANIARRYLLPTGLLYRGGVSCVHTAHRNDL